MNMIKGESDPAADDTGTVLSEFEVVHIKQESSCNVESEFKVSCNILS
jgi:hypothetical protein